MIPPPHGGHLVNTQLSPHLADKLRADLIDLPQIWPEYDQLLDADKIGVGAYSPLDGFMGQEALDSVLRSSRLPNSLPWTIPIVLTPPGSRNRRTIDQLRPGDDVALLSSRNNFIALLHLREKFGLDRQRMAKDVYKTTDTRHPNVADLRETGDTVLAGSIQLVRRMEAPAGPYEFTPTETRQWFDRHRWSTVAAYQTRNVPHRAHEHLQRMTLESDAVDGLFVHPVIGRLKQGDYQPDVILSAYETLIRNYYPPGRVLLGSLSIAMRYAGPRAALFLAIVRKNFGCSHYIVGRDQAGVGGFYDPYDSQRIFDDLPIGIVPIRYPESFFCRRCDGIVSGRSCPHPEESRLLLSQTRIRQAIAEGQPPPPELLRPEVAALLMRREALFVEPLDPTSSPFSGWSGPGTVDVEPGGPAPEEGVFQRRRPSDIPPPEVVDAPQ